MALWVATVGSVDAVPLGVSLYSAMSRNPGLLMSNAVAQLWLLTKLTVK